MDNIVGIASGKNHSLFLHADGTVSGIGSNSVYQLGIEGYEIVEERIKIPTLSDIIQVAAAGSHSLSS